MKGGGMGSNWLESMAGALRRWPGVLDPATLVARAVRRTGLSDFGDPPLDPALEILARSLENEADLHPVGRFLVSSHLTELLTLRLRLIEAWKRAPDAITAARISRPLVITGMPRSGSTLLHELLAADCGNRAPLVWEVMDPVAPPGARIGSDPRMRRAARRLWWFRQLAPDADAVHPFRADSPQECEAIHSYTFQSEEFLSVYSVPSYEAWLRTADFGPVYAWQKRFLQHLQGEGPALRWVLKSPDHAHSLAAMFQVFPDAVIVQTHREPADVLASSLQLVEVLHKTFAYSRGREDRARREARVLADAALRLLRFRESHPELAGRFADVKYSEFIADPLSTVERIYDHWGVDLDPAAIEAMRALLARRSRYSPRRNPSDFSEVHEDLGAELHRFDPYCDRFGFRAQRREASPPLGS